MSRMPQNPSEYGNIEEMSLEAVPELRRIVIGVTIGMAIFLFIGLGYTIALWTCERKMIQHAGTDTIIMACIVDERR